METKEEIPNYVPPGEPKKWYHNGWFSRSFLIVSGLFFLLPFIDISCGGKKLASVHGTDLIFGKDLNKSVEKSPDEVAADSADKAEEGSLDNMMGSGSPFETGDQKKMAPNILGILAFSSVILALLLTFFNKRLPIIIAGGFAILGALALFFIQVHLNSEVETKLGPFSFMGIAFTFTPYYWLCLLFLVLGGVFSFIRSTRLVK